MIYIFSSLIFSCNSFKGEAYSIHGSINGVSNGKIYLQKFRNKIFETSDSSDIVAGNFKFSGSVKFPELYAMQVEGSDKSLPFFIENSSITVTIDTSRIDSFKITGSAANDLFAAYKSTPEAKFDIHQFIMNHPGSTVAAYILYRDFSYQLSTKDLEKYTRMFDKAISESAYITSLNELIALLKKVEIGAQAPDFTLPDTEGKMVSLYSFHGNYILLDFWASWCPYCREENPNVVKAYARFRDKGLTIVGISLDKKKESWLKAIEDDKLSWNHLSSLTKWDNPAVRTYGIRGIPSNVLIDKSGKIIAKNLMGEKLIATLDSVMKGS